MALLHPPREPGRAGGAAARAALAHLLAERHAGDRARARRGGAGARAGAALTRLPVQLARQPAGAQRTYVVSNTITIHVVTPINLEGLGRCTFSRYNRRLAYYINPHSCLVLRNSYSILGIEYTSFQQ